MENKKGGSARMCNIKGLKKPFMETQFSFF